MPGDTLSPRAWAVAVALVVVMSVARRVEERITEIPLIKKAREVLGAQILEQKTDPEFGAGAGGSETDPADDEQE